MLLVSYTVVVRIYDRRELNADGVGRSSLLLKYGSRSIISVVWYGIRIQSIVASLLLFITEDISRIVHGHL